MFLWIKEFGCPHELLTDHPNGYFAKMVQKTGEASARTLTQLAEISCRRNLAQRSLDLTHADSVDDSGFDNLQTTRIWNKKESFTKFYNAASQ